MIRLRTAGALVATAVLLAAPAAASQAQAHTSADRAAGHQKIVIVSTDPNNDGGTIAATGPIHAKGKDVALKGHKDRFEFSNGNLMISHKRTKGSGHQSYDPVTCLFSFSEKGTWKTVDGSTGAYANAKGSGKYRAVGYGFTCDQNTAPDPFFTQITASGNLSY